ncbi:MAG: hypothetical protein M3011_07785 [Actinomycetota bacterium]|nr:hypothetical protein [Actinomycetota bacterium]
MTRPPEFGRAYGIGPWDPAPDDQAGVWWTQATFSAGLAQWKCPLCWHGGEGLSLWWARLRYWAHRRVCR